MSGVRRRIDDRLVVTETGVVRQVLSGLGTGFEPVRDTEAFPEP